MNINTRKIRAFTLVEVLVALTLSSIIIIVIGQAYVVSNNMSIMTSELTRMQESGRYAIKLIKNEIRLAGNWGCAEIKTNNLNTSGSAYVDYFTDYITGTDGSTDAITLSRASLQGENLTAAMSSTTANIAISTSNTFAQDDIAIINDCINADIFQITNSNPASGSLVHTSNGTHNPNNSTDSLSIAYDTEASVYPLRVTQFYIATGSSGNPTLFRSINGAAEELIDNVENLEITYGIDTTSDNSANQYVSAGSVGNWEDVVSVRVELLLRTNANFTTPDQTYIFSGSSTTATDDRLRYVFVTTIQLRNSIL